MNTQDELQSKVKSKETWLEVVRSGFVEKCLEEVENVPGFFEGASWFVTQFVNYLEQGEGLSEDDVIDVSIVVSALVWLINAMYLFVKELEEEDKEAT